MIRIENVHKEYDCGLIKALNGVSCHIESGEIVALMGPSGSGKTTLLSIMGTIDQPSSGNVWLGGEPLSRLKPFDRFRAVNVGFIFQLHHLMPHLNALENVEIPMLSIHSRRSERRQKARILLDAVSLGHRAAANPSKLSGGERQRVAIARAFANSPQIILADEPTGSLDTETGDQVLKLIVDQCRMRQTTVIVATHNREVAERADRIICLKNGKIESAIK